MIPILQMRKLRPGDRDLIVCCHSASVGMKLTDVGIATLAKGYKGFKGNCSMTFIDQFKALHQCNKYCKMLGLKSLQNNSQKQKKPSTGKSKVQANSMTVKKTGPETPGEKKT